MHFTAPAFAPEICDALYPLPRETRDTHDWLRRHGYDLSCLAPAALHRELERLTLRLLVEPDVPDPWLIERRTRLTEALACHRHGLPVPCPPTTPAIRAKQADLRAVGAIHTARLIAARGEEPAAELTDISRIAGLPGTTRRSHA